MYRTLTVGGWLTLHTAECHGIRAGASIATVQPFIYENEDQGGSGVLPDDQSGITVFNQAYLSLTMNKTTITVFRQVLDTPYLDHEDDRLIPTTYEAYGLRDNTLKHLEMEAFCVNGIKLQNSDTFQSMTAAAGIPDQDEGLVYAVGLDLVERFLT